MQPVTYDSIVTPELSAGAIINEGFPGFREDYLVLHCLLRKYQPKTVLEIGTNTGIGTKIICNAVPDAKVMSLDLPDDQAYRSKSRIDGIGQYCDLPYTQLWGDSLEFDYASLGQVDAWFVDGEHDYEHVFHEAAVALGNGAKLIAFHDADIPEVANGIRDGAAFVRVNRVVGTRIAFISLGAS